MERLISPLFESRNFKGPERAQLVEDIKKSATVLLEKINQVEINSENGRLVSFAKTHLEETVMWSVKALSRE